MIKKKTAFNIIQNSGNLNSRPQSG